MAGSEKCKKGLDEYARRLLAAFYLLCDHYSMNMGSYAKCNAPWMDRTGHARGGLFGQVIVEGGFMKARISHSMEYGVYLELANSRKYAILDPTVRKFEGQFMADARKLVDNP